MHGEKRRRNHRRTRVCRVHHEESRAAIQSCFHEKYLALLRDTGRMTAEDLVEKHLGVSISEPDFWARSIAIVERKLDLGGA